MDEFLITGNGLSIDFSVPVSTTGPDYIIENQVMFGPLMGTVNGADATISTNFVTMSGCAVCPSLLLSYQTGSTPGNLTLALPPLYEITPSGIDDATLTFLTGSYTTGTIPFSGDIYNIQVTAEAAVTPEPSTLLLLLIPTALGGALLIKQRAFRDVSSQA
jgi:hypothetical protein